MEEKTPKELDGTSPSEIAPWRVYHADGPTIHGERGQGAYRESKEREARLDAQVSFIPTLDSLPADVDPHGQHDDNHMRKRLEELRD